MQGQIQLGRPLRIDFIQTFSNPVGLAATKKLGYRRGIQLAPRYPELTGCNFSQAEKIVGQ
jgi:hypothetical protein